MHFCQIFIIFLGLNSCVEAATISPPPIIQTLGSSEIGPEFNAINKEAEASKDDKPTILEDADYWEKVGLKQLKRTINLQNKAENKNVNKKAKNIIIFIGDGMGLTTITAGRIFKGQHLNHNNGEEEMLSFDEFPSTGLAKTYNVDMQVPDSAGTATAIFTGSKTDYGAIGVDATRSKTDASKGKVASFMEWAQEEGKRTGIVTTTRITHATPAASYAHIYHRDWECDSKVPKESVGIHVDIARQLVENSPGNKFNVIMGGGLRPMGATDNSEIKTVNFEGDTETICKRDDGRNLVREWLENRAPNETRVFVQKREDLLKADLKNVDGLMGLFRNNHITYSIAREEGEPSLEEMTKAAIAVLDRENNSKGFVLLVEGGRIDQAHHQNYARAAMYEVVEFDKAVAAALNMTNQEETLILVTADHSHSVTLNGYPKRGADILGYANKTTEPVIYETITYANGPGYWDHLANETQNTNSSFVWIPLDKFTEIERQSPTYRHMATIPLKDESHGGEDVVVFANGPASSLIRGVFEQNYLAYVMSYAGCMGPAKSFDDSCQKYSTTNNASLYSISTLMLISLLSLLRFL